MVIEIKKIIAENFLPTFITCETPPVFCRELNNSDKIGIGVLLREHVFRGKRNSSGIFPILSILLWWKAS